jgi:hypothetical protein
MRQRVALVLLLVLSFGAAADYKKSYGLGLKAHDSGSDSEAIRHFREALADRAEPQARARLTGMEIKPYAPQVYLAHALARSGQCGEVNGLLAQAGVSAVVAQVALLGSLASDARQRCAASVATRPSPPVATPPAVVNQPAASVAQTAQPPRQTPAATPPPSQTQTVRSPAISTQPAAPPKLTPPALTALAQTLLRGDWLAASRAPVESISEARARAFALALRAVAKLMLADGNPAQAAALRASAQTDLASARRLDSKLALNPQAFPPAIRAALAAR